MWTELNEESKPCGIPIVTKEYRRASNILAQKDHGRGKS